jgi:hypothetical protein
MPPGGKHTRTVPVDYLINSRIDNVRLAAAPLSFVLEQCSEIERGRKKRVREQAFILSFFYSRLLFLSSHARARKKGSAWYVFPSTQPSVLLWLPFTLCNLTISKQNQIVSRVRVLDWMRRRAVIGLNKNKAKTKKEKKGPDERSQ